MTLSADVAEFETLVEWCGALIDEKSAPGFVVGISGTDSILAFLVCAEAFRRRGRPDRVIGVHFGRNVDPDISQERLTRILELTPSYRWVAREVMPWLQAVAPRAQVRVDEQAADLDDHARWAKLFAMSLAGVDKTEMLDGTQNYWVVGTRNATEEALGTYSNLSMAASLQPIIRLWKSDVLRLCRLLNVPEVAVSQSRQVDCDCGRFDLAADHIEEVDVLLRKKLGVSLAADRTFDIPIKLEQRLNAFIEEQTAASEFKRQIPYKPAPALREVAAGEAGRPVDKRETWLDTISKLNAIRRACMTYGLGFSSWRFPAMSAGGQSLLELYGFRKLERATDHYPDPALKDPDRDLYGTGFVLSDDETYFELRRAYILVASYVNGVQVTLVIRNSSPYFGYNRLSDPVLVSTSKLKFSDLEELTPSQFARHFVSLDWLVAHAEPWRDVISLEDLVSYLSDQVAYLRLFEAGFDEWLDREGRPELLAFLARLSAQGRHLPYVGLVDVGQPQWFPSNVEPLKDADVPLVLDGLFRQRRIGTQRLALLSGPSGDRS